MRPVCYFLSCALNFAAGTMSLFAASEINPPAEPDRDQVTALMGARLIDGRGGVPVENSIVLVRGSRILSVGSVGKVAMPASARRVEVQGMSLLPGLIDSHFHSRYSIELPLDYELKNGITSFRDPGHPFRFYDTVREYKGTLPRVFLCGAHLDGPPPVYRPVS